MTSKKVLFVSQEIVPYVPSTPAAEAGRSLPQTVQTAGGEIRIFMPRWGSINERRNQLHEVIRLSGMNIIINDSDHPLIIKVASIQAARMQVYFIDNDEYFHKRGMMSDPDGTIYDDNHERAIFFARGVLETIKKLSWHPDIICCQGWISSIVPYYVKTAYNEEPPFMGTKVVFSSDGIFPSISADAEFGNCLKFGDATPETLTSAGIEPTDPNVLSKLAVRFSDGIICTSPEFEKQCGDYATANGKRVLPFSESNGDEQYMNFIDEF